MICPPCKAAGQINAAAREASGETAEAFLVQAREAHERCQWPENCPCRHQVGPCTAKETEVPK